MFKLFILSKMLNFLLVGSGIKTEGDGWVSGKLSDSYENQVLTSIGLPSQGKSMEEYRKIFWDLGLEIEYIEVKREMVWFDGIEPLRNWIRAQVETEFQAEQYFLAMEERGWVHLNDGRIGFPTKQLIARLKASNTVVKEQDG